MLDGQRWQISAGERLAELCAEAGMLDEDELPGLEGHACKLPASCNNTRSTTKRSSRANHRKDTMLSLGWVQSGPPSAYSGCLGTEHCSQMSTARSHPQHGESP
eukprot:5672761-Amphidinium_carterae.1